MFNAIITIVSGGNCFLPISIIEKNKLTNTEEKKKSSKLTPMERKILKMIIDGLPSSVIAERLNLSERTVENHRYRINKKAKSNNRFNIFKFAIEHGVV